VDTMKIAGVYKLEGLYQFCIKYVLESITRDNISKLLKHCDATGAATGRQLCIDFAVNRDTRFTSGDIEILGQKLYSEVTAAQLKSKKQDKPEVQMAYEDPIVNDFKTVYESDTKDIIFNLQGQEVKVHKSFLLIQSAEFTQLVNEESRKNPNVLSLHQKYCTISSGAFDSMFRFFYYGFKNFDILHACQLFLFAREMRLDKLSIAIEFALSKKDFNQQSILPILDVAFNPLLNSNPDLQKQLQENGLKYAVQNVDKIDFGVLMYMSPIVGMNILISIQHVLGNNWANYSEATSTINDLPKSPSFNIGHFKTESRSDVSDENSMSERGDGKKKGSVYRNKKKKK